MNTTKYTLDENGKLTKEYINHDKLKMEQIIRSKQYIFEEEVFVVSYTTFKDTIPEEKLEEMKLSIREVLRARKQLLQAQVKLIEKKENIINNLIP